MVEKGKKEKLSKSTAGFIASGKERSGLWRSKSSRCYGSSPSLGRVAEGDDLEAGEYSITLKRVEEEEKMARRD